MRLQLNVTANDIRLGTQGACDKCAVARSVARTLKVPMRNLEVTQDSITVSDDAFYERYVFAVSGRMADFIENFDTDKRNVKPTTFTVYGMKLF